MLVMFTQTQESCVEDVCWRMGECEVGGGQSEAWTHIAMVRPRPRSAAITAPVSVSRQYHRSSEPSFQVESEISEWGCCCWYWLRWSTYSTWWPDLTLQCLILWFLFSSPWSRVHQRRSSNPWENGSATTVPWWVILAKNLHLNNIRCLRQRQRIQMSVVLQYSACSMVSSSWSFSSQSTRQSRGRENRAWHDYYWLCCCEYYHRISICEVYAK